MSKTYFQQSEPCLGNQYLEDSILLDILSRKVPSHILKSIESELIRFGERVSPAGDILRLGKLCEFNPPKLQTYNSWGRRIDNIICDASWDKLHDISAEEGLIAIGYERKYGEWSRLFQYIKYYLFSTGCGTYTCPLAMGDGAARLLEVYGDKVKNERHRQTIKNAYQRLTSRNPAQFWTSGQWMTEKTGGSDIRPSETIARYDASRDIYLLSGLKFFTSATTSEMAITLARIKPDQPLSAFYLETRNPKGELNGIKILRLKDKLGTRSVPTAELELENTEAILLGKEGEGVKVISELLNITRIFNSCSSVAACRRSIAIARDYASRRTAFGKLLKDNPLHLSTLAELEVEFRACLHFLIDVLIKFGRSEVQPNPKETVLLRILTPLIKLYTGKQSIAIASEGIEAVGGTGYMEDSFIPVILRNTQVTSIWEGTTNVLAHDLWRPIQNQNALPIYMETIHNLIHIKDLPTRLAGVKSAIEDSLKVIEDFVGRVRKNPNILEPNERQFAFTMARTYMCALLLEHAAAVGKDADFITAVRFSKQLVVLKDETDKARYDRLLALDVDESTGRERGIGDLDQNNKIRARY